MQKSPNTKNEIEETWNSATAEFDLIEILESQGFKKFEVLSTKYLNEFEVYIYEDFQECPFPVRLRFIYDHPHPGWSWYQI